MTGLSDQEIERALDYLRDNSDAAAKARAERIYIEEYRKSLKAQIMKEQADMPVSAQEREAYSDERYVRHLDAIRDAVHEDERHRFLMRAAEAKIDAWRTKCSNQRAMKL